MNKLIKIKYVGLVLIYTWIFQAILPASGLAESPWKWQRTLRIEKPGDAMYMPSAVSFDPDAGRYYVVDTGNNRLVSFDRDGQMLKAFSADNRLSSPFDMVRLDNGKLWVVEKGRNSLTLIDVAAKEVKPIDLRYQGQRVFPDRIAYGDGKIYLLDRATGQVLRFNQNLDVEQTYGCEDCIDGFADFRLNNGAIWALETLGKKIYRFNPEGKIVETIHLKGSVGFPVSLAIGSDESFYILDRHRNQIVAFNRDGNFLYNFLALGQGAGQVYFPRELRFDPWGQLCVVDEGNGRVEIFSR